MTGFLDNVSNKWWGRGVMESSRVGVFSSQLSDI